MRLYYIQVKDSVFFTKLGTQQYNITVTQAPPRAPIYDRSGKQFFAMNKECLSAFILPNKLENSDTLLPFLQEHFPHAYEYYKKQKHKHFMYIKRRLSSEQEKLIAQAQIADIKLLYEQSRFYPNKSTGPLIGLTDIDNNGVMGLELQCNSCLAGTPSTYAIQKDARLGYAYFKKETIIEGQHGKPIQLTIDSNLQFLAHEELAQTIKNFNAHEGAVIIMNPENGEILAMVSIPHFNPNDTQHLDIALTKNKIITEAYELGSVIKTFAALAALDEQLVTPQEHIDCKNTKTAYIDGRKVNTVLADGVISFTDVLRRSNNIGMAIVAKRLGTLLYDHYKRIGFGKKTGITFPGEALGHINPPNQWSKQSIISLSYGYEISASLLQLATSFCTIANNGCKVYPKLILKPNTNHFPLDNGIKLYSRETITALKEILEETTLEITQQRAKKYGYHVMSKTGTANMLVDGKYDSSKNIYTCAGIIKKDDYQRVIVTFIKQAEQKNLYAATVAAPLFDQIAQKLLIHDRII